MVRVLLIHAGKIPHYRIPIYCYLSSFLKKAGFDLLVTSDGIEKGSEYHIDFNFFEMNLTTLAITRLVYSEKIDVIIDYMELRHPYLFPVYLIAKYIMGKKMIYWGQGRDLANVNARAKNAAYATEQAMSDAIILYAPHLKKYVPKRFHEKTFVANNTLFFNYNGLPEGHKKKDVLARYGIRTKKNIICVGRIQKRKRIEHITNALSMMNRKDVGLIIVGPDNESVLDNIGGRNIYKLGPIYGDEKLELLCAADVYCLPGAVGLSVIDAFHCGLPFVTEDGDESAEIMYVKNGVNGYIVNRGDVKQLSQKLKMLIDDERLRLRFSDAAKKEIKENGSIEKLCEGFRAALCYATKSVDS